MTPLILITLGIAWLLMMIGGIMLIIAAFRQSVLWGICYLFIPFASLVFLFKHWEKAREGFLIQLIGMALVIGVIVPNRELLSSGITADLYNHAIHKSTSKQEPSAVSRALLDARKDVETAQAELSILEPKVNRMYAELSEKRKTLIPADHPGVRAFNIQAAEYNREKARLAAQKTELVRLKKQEELLVAQEQARTDRAGEGEVVMYSTSWCPACKAAKAYFARRNIHYKDFDVEKSPEARVEYERLGGHGVPLIIVKGERMTGFNEPRLNQLL